MVNAMSNESKSTNLTLVEILLVADIKHILNRCEADYERDFLSEFGAYRRDVVYKQKIIESERFDELCQVVLDDVKKDGE